MEVSHEVTSLVRRMLRASSSTLTPSPNVSAFSPRPERLGLGAALPQDAERKKAKNKIDSLIRRKIVGKKPFVGEPPVSETVAGVHSGAVSTSDGECSRSVIKQRERSHEVIGTERRRKKRRKKKNVQFGDNHCDLDSVDFRLAPCAVLRGGGQVEGCGGGHVEERGEEVQDSGNEWVEDQADTVTTPDKTVKIMPSSGDASSEDPPTHPKLGTCPASAISCKLKHKRIITKWVVPHSTLPFSTRARKMQRSRLLQSRYQRQTKKHFSFCT